MSPSPRMPVASASSVPSDPAGASVSVIPTDVVVIGGGPVGENAAQYAHDGGLDVVLIEEDLLGGECSYHACMPSKALLRPLEVRDASRNLPGLHPAALDREALLARRDAWVSGYDDSSQMAWAEGAGLRVIRGRGRLVGEREVQVSGRADRDVRLQARRAVVLATGSGPVVPPLFSELAPWLPGDATGVIEVPERLLIVGGGAVACEAATWMSALGSRVTMLVRGQGLLHDLEPFVGPIVQEALEAAGVRVVLGADVSAAHREDPRATGLGRIHGGPVTLTVDGVPHEAEEVLLATGRTPRLEDLGLEELGLGAADVRGGTLPPWLHAIGDAGGSAHLTHMGKYEARVLGARLAGEAESVPPRVPTPQVIFTDPQVAAVGLTETRAREDGPEVVTAQVPFASAAGTALLRDDGVGEAKLVVDRATGHLLGATFVGREAAELLHGASIAIIGEVPVSTLRHAVPSYPTSSELWLRLLEELPRELR